MREFSKFKIRRGALCNDLADTERELSVLDREETNSVIDLENLQKEEREVNDRIDFLMQRLHILQQDIKKRESRREQQQLRPQEVRQRRELTRMSLQSIEAQLKKTKIILQHSRVVMDLQM